MENKPNINRKYSHSMSYIRGESNPKVHVLPEHNVIFANAVNINIQQINEAAATELTPIRDRKLCRPFIRIEYFVSRKNFINARSAKNRQTFVKVGIISLSEKL